MSKKKKKKLYVKSPSPQSESPETRDKNRIGDEVKKKEG